MLISPPMLRAASRRYTRAAAMPPLADMPFAAATRTLHLADITYADFRRFVADAFRHFDAPRLTRHACQRRRAQRPPAMPLPHAFRLRYAFAVFRRRAMLILRDYADIFVIFC